MQALLGHSLTVFMAFFAIMNPIANTAVFVSLAGERDKAAQRQLALKALTITFTIVLAFSILGKVIFHLFGITLPALRIAGGALVFVIGYHMLHGSSSKLHTGQESEETDIAISPLAVPLLAGPGTIATAMNYSAAGGWTAIIVTIAAFVALCVITFICFMFSSRILAAIGESGLGIVTRLMGLILAVIGVQMLIAGITAAIRVSGLMG